MVEGGFSAILGPYLLLEIVVALEFLVVWPILLRGGRGPKDSLIGFGKGPNGSGIAKLTADFYLRNFLEEEEGRVRVKGPDTRGKRPSAISLSASTASWPGVRL